MGKLIQLALHEYRVALLEHSTERMLISSYSIQYVQPMSANDFCIGLGETRSFLHKYTTEGPCLAKSKEIRKATIFFLTSL